MMRIYIDTEFSDLVDDPHLVSIALVAHDCRHIYCELDSDGWYPHASEFVLREVWPKMRSYRTHEGQETPQEAAERIKAWFGRFDGPVEICSDSNYDWDLFKKLMAPVGWPPNVSDVWISAYWQHEIEDLNRHQKWWFSQHGYSPHHALADAMALRYAMIEQDKRQAAWVAAKAVK